MWGKNEADGQHPLTQLIVTLSRQYFQIDRTFDAVDIDLFSAAHCEGRVCVVYQLLGLKTHTANRVDGLNLWIKQETDSIVLYRAASCMDTWRQDGEYSTRTVKLAFVLKQLACFLLADHYELLLELYLLHITTGCMFNDITNVKE